MTDTNGNLVMPVAPMGSYGSGGDGFFGGNNGWWIILLLIVLGGWGNGFGGFGGGNGGMFPWLMNGQANGVSDVQRGFDQSAIISGINGVQNAVTSGFGDVQTALCAGFGGINAGISNGFAQAEIANNSRQMASMNQNFAMQTALQNCCCENRAGLADVKYSIATENCADRAALSDGIRDLLTATSANTQRILDQMCNDKIDAKNEKIADLERQLTLANLAASQSAQTAAILANNEAQTSALEQYLAPVPRPAYIVQNPSCCQNYCGA